MRQLVFDLQKKKVVLINVPLNFILWQIELFLQNKRRLMTDHYKSDPDNHILLLVQHNAHQDREIVRLKQCLEKIISFSESVLGKRLRDVMDDIWLS